MPRVSVWFIRASLLYLLAGFTWGALMLANQGLRFFPQAWSLLPSHMEFLLPGWFVQLCLGVAFWVLPRFMKAPAYGNVRLAWVSFFLLNAGILTASVGGLAGGAVYLAAGRALELLGALAFGVSVWRRVKSFGV